MPDPDTLDETGNASTQPISTNSLTSELENWTLQTTSFSKPSTFVEFFWWLATSGFFFMVVGTGFLVWAFTTMGSAHAAMSFVLVVVGVAILLYGTGTQGIGILDGPDSKVTMARYKVAIAGGAGVLAFAVAAGIIMWAPEMKQAFQVEQKYIRFIVHPHSYNGQKDLENYLPLAYINGVRVPIVLREATIEIYAPYRSNATNPTFNLDLKVYALPATASKISDCQPNYYDLAPESELKSNLILRDLEITEDNSGSGNAVRSDAAFDFPFYELKQSISLTNTKFKQSTSAPLGGFVPQ